MESGGFLVAKPICVVRKCGGTTYFYCLSPCMLQGIVYYWADGRGNAVAAAVPVSFTFLSLRSISEWIG